jgi:signal transduction histidine kinase
MEYRLLRADGEYRWVLDEGVPRLHPAGDFLGYIGCCLDITDVKQAQKEALGRERVESLRVLAGGIAHDFTNLMATILSTAELAESEIADGSSAGEEIETIKTVARRAIEMARELMTYAGEDKGNVELLDLSLLVEDMADILRSSISKRSVLKIDLPRNLPRVWGNPTHMRQIVMNLIINASEAIGARGGTIQIRVSPATGEQRSDLRRIDGLGDGEYLRLEVSDNGCGMTEEQRTRIFDPFFTTKGKGSGLGLAVVHGVVHSYGGGIKVASAPGRGTTFEIYLPCIDEGSVKVASSYRESSSVH